MLYVQLVRSWHYTSMLYLAKLHEVQTFGIINVTHIFYKAGSGDKPQVLITYVLIVTKF